MEKKESQEDSARKRNAFMLKKWDLLKAIRQDRDTKKAIIG
jgi:hypothetical protein